MLENLQKIDDFYKIFCGKAEIFDPADRDIPMTESDSADTTN